MIALTEAVNEALLSLTVKRRYLMNPKFFSLPKERQLQIINAGFRVFGNNSYKKSPMSEIAAEGGISKSLLFHYFQNKKDLYLYLWKTCAEETIDEMTRSGCYEQKDLFSTLDSGMQAKLRLMKRYPGIARFAIRAFYEKDPEVCEDIQQSMQQYLAAHARKKLAALDPDDFIPGIDLEMMYKEMYWASEGYLYEQLQDGTLDPEEMERSFRKLLTFWKTVYLRKKSHPAADASKEV